MEIEPVEFVQVLVSRRQEGELLIALFDGATKDAPHALVSMLCCSDDVARGLVRALTSALLRPRT